MISKSCVLLCCVLGLVLAVEKYSSKYDNFNLKELMENKRLFDAYVDCLLDRGKCTPEGKELRENIQEAMETGCERCTDAQVEGSKTIINHMIQNERAHWKELTDKYDPKGIWRKKYEELAKKEGILIPED